MGGRIVSRGTVAVIVLATTTAVGVAASQPAHAAPSPGAVYEFRSPWATRTYDSRGGAMPGVLGGAEFRLPAGRIVEINFVSPNDGVVSLGDCGAATADDPVIAVLKRQTTQSFTAVTGPNESRCLLSTASTDIVENEVATVVDAAQDGLLAYNPLPASKTVFDGALTPYVTSTPVRFSLPSGLEARYAALRLHVDNPVGPGVLFANSFNGVNLLAFDGSGDASTIVYVPVPDPSPPGCAGFFATVCLSLTGSSADVAIELLGVFAPTGPSPAVAPPADEFVLATLPGFASSPPTRVVDTRFGTGAPAGKLVPGHTLKFDVSEYATASGVAAVLNVTADGANADGFLTVFPCDSAPPDVSNLNFRAGETRANLATVALGADGLVCVTSSASVDVIADFAGAYRFDATDGFQPINPVRKLDTRLGRGAPTGPLQSGAELRLELTAASEIPDSGVSAVTMNVTAVNPAASGFVTVYPCGTPAPNASNLNFTPGSVVPNLVTVAVGSGGAVCMRTSAPVDLLADVSGYFTPESANGFAPFDPLRVVDTRLGLGVAKRPLIMQSVLVIDFDELFGFAPGDISSVVMNVTVANTTDAGFLTVFPCNGQSTPDASNLNFAKGSAVSNLVVTQVGAGGQVCITTSAATDVLVDVAGFGSDFSLWIAVPMERLTLADHSVGAERSLSSISHA